MAANRKVEFDQLLASANSALQKLENTFESGVAELCGLHCYKEILGIYRSCRYLDRMLKSSYFEEAELVDTIQHIRRELKKEQTERLLRNATKLYESNRRHELESLSSPTEDDDVVTDTAAAADAGGGPGKGDRNAETGASQQPAETVVPMATDEQGSLSHADTGGASEAIARTVSNIPELSNWQSLQHEIQSIEHDLLDMHTKVQAVQEDHRSAELCEAEGSIRRVILGLTNEVSQLEKKYQDAREKLARTKGALAKVAGRDHAQTQTDGSHGKEFKSMSVQTDEASATTAKKLCMTACKLLRQQMVKVRWIGWGARAVMFEGQGILDEGFVYDIGISVYLMCMYVILCLFGSSTAKHNTRRKYKKTWDFPLC